MLQPHSQQVCRSLQRPSNSSMQLGGTLGRRWTPKSSSRSTPPATAAAASRKDNPDLDDIVLDDDYYREIGMTRQQAMRQQQEVLYSVDPDATPLGLDTLGTINPDVLPDDLRKAVESIEVYGPQALLLAGFRAEEYAVIRATLDSLGAQQVKVLPTSDDMLYNSLEAALQAPEIDWSAPRPPEWIRGGTWGSQRTILFSGLSIKAQATLLELLEAQGLPPLCVTMATKDDAARQLGEVMADAVKAQRSHKPTPITPWEMNRPATPSTANSSSSSSAKKAAAPWTPGKKGRLFEKRSGGSSGGAAGLESLSELIPPEVARARLQFDPAIGSSKQQASQQAPKQGAQQQQQQQGGAAWGGQQFPPPFTTGGQQEEEEQPVTRLPDADASDQDLLHWFNNELGGPSVELPWTDEDSSAAAAAAAAGMGFPGETQQQQQQQQGKEGDGAVSLDDLFAAAAAAGPDAAPSSSSSSSSSSSLLEDLRQGAAQPQPISTPSWASNASSSSSSSSSSGRSPRPLTDQGLELDGLNPEEPASMLTIIQSALKSGVSPDQLKQLIDQAAAESAGAADEVDLLLNQDAQKAAAARAAAAAAAAAGTGGDSSSSSSSSSQAASARRQQQQQQQQQYGPARPPPPADDGLVNLRPEVEAAFANRQVKFVDLSKLPKKYKQRYSLEALKQQRAVQQEQAVQLEQQREEKEQQQQQQQGGKGQQRWWQQQSRRQQMARNLPGQVLSNLPTGGRVVKVEVGGDVAAAAAAAGVAGSSGVDSSSSSKVRPLYDVNSYGSGSSSSSDSAAAAVAADPFFNAGPGGPAGPGADVSRVSSRGGPGTGQYDAEFTYLSAAATAAGGGFGSSQQQQQQQEPADNSSSSSRSTEQAEDESSDGPDLVLDESKLQQLVDSARQEGLDVSRALAEAVAFGVRIPPEAAAAVGVVLPAADAVSAVREGIVAAIRDMQDAETAAAAAAAAAAAGEGPGTGVAEGVGAQRVGGEDVCDISSRSSSSRRSGRAWGSGLTAAVQRAKACRQQQQQ